MKPEYWADEKLGPMVPIDRLVFLGIISMADDFGRLVDSMKQIDAFIFPYTPDSAEPSLQRLYHSGRIRRGVTKSGQRIIEISNWSLHQKVDHPNRGAALPPIVSEVVVSVRDSTSNVTLPDQPSEALANGSRPIPDGFATLSVPVPVPTISTNDLIRTSAMKRADQIEPESFGLWWSRYPKRSGNNPKAKALKAYRSRLGQGIKPETLLQGLDRYSRFCETKKIVGTGFVMLASSWLNGNEGWKQGWETDGCPASPDDLPAFPDYPKPYDFSETGS